MNSNQQLLLLVFISLMAVDQCAGWSAERERGRLPRHLEHLDIKLPPRGMASERNRRNGSHGVHWKNSAGDVDDYHEIHEDEYDRRVEKVMDKSKPHTTGAKVATAVAALTLAPALPLTLAYWGYKHHQKEKWKKAMANKSQ